MKEFDQGDFLLQYRGELISAEEGADRLKDKEGIGSFIYFYREYWLDTFLLTFHYYVVIRGFDPEID